MSARNCSFPIREVTQDIVFSSIKVFHVEHLCVFAGLLRPINNLSTHNRGDNFSCELPAVKRCVARFGARLRGLEGPTLLGIKDGDVGEAAAGERTAAAEVEDARGACGKELDNSGEWDPVFAVQPSDRETERGF